MKTDQELLEDVIAELKLNRLVGAAQIYVSVLAGVVKLAGRVGSVQERLEAERTVHTVSGVRGVSLSIGIVSAACIVRSDLEMTRSAAEASHWLSLPDQHTDTRLKYEWDP